MHKFSCQNSSLRHFAEHLNLSSLPLPCIPLFLPIPLSLSLSPFSSLPSFLPLFLSSSLPLSLSPSLPLSLTPSLPLSLSPSLPLLSLFSPSLCAIQPGVRRGACVRALPCPRFRAAPTPPHSDAGHARLPRVHGHLHMDAPQEHKARLQPPRHRSAGGGWGPGHGGTAQPIACAPSALARAQAPEPLVRVPQRRAHRARRAAPAHGGAGRRGARRGTAAAAGARATRRRGRGGGAAPSRAARARVPDHHRVPDPR